jgi:hypothetical protein
MNLGFASRKIQRQKNFRGSIITLHYDRNGSVDNAGSDEIFSMNCRKQQKKCPLFKSSSFWSTEIPWNVLREIHENSRDFRILSVP